VSEQRLLGASPFPHPRIAFPLKLPRFSWFAGYKICLKSKPSFFFEDTILNFFKVNRITMTTHMSNQKPVNTNGGYPIILSRNANIGKGTNNNISRKNNVDYVVGSQKYETPLSRT
jgi:hypothetical protein